MGKSGFWKSDSFDSFFGVVSIVILFAGNGDLLQGLERKAYDLGVAATSRTPSAKAIATTVFYSEPQRDPGLAYIDRLMTVCGMAAPDADSPAPLADVPAVAPAPTFSVPSACPQIAPVLVVAKSLNLTPSGIKVTAGSEVRLGKLKIGADPDQRYPTGAEFARDLRICLAMTGSTGASNSNSSGLDISI